jgi:hypothetical protein
MYKCKTNTENIYKVLGIPGKWLKGQNIQDRLKT